MMNKTLLDLEETDAISAILDDQNRSPSWLLTFRIIACITETLTNGTLIAATWNSKELRSVCNLLIALDAAYFFIIGLIELIFLLLGSFFGVVPLSSCFWAIAPSVVIIETTTVMPLSIAVERFINVFFPLWTRRVNNNKLGRMILMALPALVWGTIQLLFFGFTVLYDKPTTDPSREVICMGLEVFALYNHNRHVMNNNFLMILVCWFIYAIIYAKVKMKERKFNANGETRRSSNKLFCTLGVFLLVITLGWVPGPLYRLVQSVRGVPARETKLHFKLIAIFSIGFYSIVMAPALYAFSMDYRTAVNQLFPKRLFKYQRADTRSDEKETSSSKGIRHAPSEPHKYFP